MGSGNQARIVLKRSGLQPRKTGVSLLRMAAALFLATTALYGQVPSPAPSAPSVPPHKAVPHRKTSPANPIETQAEPAPPPAPEMPKWPLNDPPASPSIRWDSHGLQVAASNASLRQILDDVASTTGAKVEGLGPDERVFGDYGPGPARDVISQILNGSSYNVLMLGDQGEGTPREIILSERTKTGAQPAGGQVNNRPPSPDEDVEQPEPEEPNRQPMNQPMNQPGAPMTPQQRMIEMQRQQMQMQQQQQQGQPIQPPPQPPQ